MTRHLRLAILTLVVLTLPGVAARADQTTDTSSDAAPDAVVDQPVVDVGKIAVGTPIDADFTIRNDGDAPLQILQATPSCGCTVAKFDKEIPPGGTGQVHATVDTSNMGGAIAKSVTVYTNDRIHPRLQLTIKAEIRLFLVVQPGYARFTSVVHGIGKHDASQVLWTDDFDDLKVLGVESPEPWIHTDFHKAVANERSKDGKGTQWVVDISLDKDAPVGPVADYVVVKTNHPKQAEVQIPVSGFVRPLVAVTPPTVKFGTIDPSKGQSWGVLMRNFGSEPLEIESYKSTVPGLEVKVEPIKEGLQYKVTLTPTESMGQGSFNGQVEIQTNLPQQKTIAIDLSGDVAPAESGS